MSKFFEIDYNDYEEIAIFVERKLATDRDDSLVTVDISRKGQRFFSVASEVAKLEGLRYVPEGCGIFSKNVLDKCPTHFPEDKYDVYTAKLYRVKFKKVDKKDLLYPTNTESIEKELVKMTGDNCGIYKVQQYSNFNAPASFNADKDLHRFYEESNLHYTLHLDRKPRIYTFICDVSALKRYYDDTSKYKLKTLVAGVDLYKRFQLKQVKAVAEEHGFDTGYYSTNPMSNDFKNRICFVIGKKYYQKIVNAIPTLIAKLKEEDKDLIDSFTTLGINTDPLYEEISRNMLSACQRMAIAFDGKKGLEDMIALLDEKGECVNDK